MTKPNSMILVYADNYRMADDFMRKLHGTNPDLDLTKANSWKYISPPISIMGYRGSEVVLLNNWFKYQPEREIDNLNFMLEIGDLTDRTQHYIDLINK